MPPKTAKRRLEDIIEEDDGECEANVVGGGVGPTATEADLLYLKLKEEFEVNHFYYVPTNTFVEVDKEGVLHHYTYLHAKEYFDTKWYMMNEPCDNMNIRHFKRQKLSFLDHWRVDDTRRTIHRIEFTPSDDPTVFYTPIRFAWSKMYSPPQLADGEEEEEGMEEVLEAYNAENEALWADFMTLVKSACSDQQPLIDYFLNYIAHILQEPLVLPGVAVVLTGKKGVGKDTILDFLRLHVVGDHLSHNYTETRQFFDKHDIDRRGKFFIKVEDSDSAVCKSFAKDLRARITAREGTINPKGKDPITFPNYMRLFFTANQAIPVGLNDDNDRERRILLLPVDSTLKGNFDFFSKVYNEKTGLFTARGGWVVGSRLAARDLSGFNPRVLPANEYQEAMFDTDRTPIQRFAEDEMQEDGIWYPSNELFQAFQQYCIANGYPTKDNNAIAFGQKLSYFVLHGTIEKKVGAKKLVSYRKRVKEVPTATD